MTRPDKHAARFGDRYRIPGGETYLPVGFNIRKFSKALRDAMPAIQRITAGFRQVADNMRQAREMEETARQVEAVFHGPGERWTYAPHIANPAAPTVAELEAGTEIHGLSFWHEPPEVGSTIGRMGGRVSAGTHSGGDVVDIDTSDPEALARFERLREVIATGGHLGSVTGRLGMQPDILDRIDDTLLSYDAQHADGDEPWPYRGF